MNMTAGKTEVELVDSREIARIFGVSISTVRGWVRAGLVPYLRPSRRVVRFNVADVQRALTRNPQSGVHDESAATL